MRKVGSLVLAGVLALALASPAVADTTGGGGGPGAAYSDGMAITITSAKVVAKVLVEVTFDVTCDPAPDGATWDENYFRAYVRQAAGRSIATGEVDWYANDVAALCDGETHSLTATVPADYGSVPFKSGTAVVGVTGNASYYAETCDEWGWCDWSGGSRKASTGWMTYRLRK